MSHLPQENAASVSEEGEGFTKIGEVLVRTEALDAYVAEKVNELEAWKASACVIGNDQQREIADLTAKLALAEERAKELEEQYQIYYKGWKVALEQLIKERKNTLDLTADLAAAEDRVKELEGALSTNDERMTDFMYRVWRKINADVAGLKWSEFIDAIRAERDAAIERSEWC